MANPLRFLDESFACVDEGGQRWFLVEVTQRTHRGRYLLRPGRDTRAVFLGAAGYARARVPGVSLLDYHCMSNHFGLVLAVRDLRSLAAFEQAMNGRLSKELKWLRGYDDFVFPNAYRMVQVADEAALRERFVYGRGNCVKEGLVRHPSQWTGPHAARQWHHGEVARGYYHDFTAYDRARRSKRGAQAKLSDFRRYVTVELEKAPCWQQMDDAAYARFQRSLSDEAATRYAQAEVAGARACELISPLYEPDAIANDPLPLRLIGSLADREAYRERLRATRTAYTAVIQRWRALMTGLHDHLNALIGHSLAALALPVGTLPPGAWCEPDFIRSPARATGLDPP